MPVFSKKNDLTSFLHQDIPDSSTIGLVPTMGALHRGHLSLVKRALAENGSVVVSIFVNPTQFDNHKDLDKYPRNLDDDINLLRKLSEKIIVFAPSVDEIYGQNVQSKDYEFNGLDKVMEGTFRKGHFEGVGTVVELLFKTVAPDRAYFGEKDFQQLQIIKKLVHILDLPVEIIGCPIEREPHGLAMSSRNERLSDKTRKKANFIYHTLKDAKRKFGMENAKQITNRVIAEFKHNEDFELEYFQITDEDTLTPVITKQNHIKYRAFIAVYADGVRLIDNLRLN